jgi:hypothetical protein
MPGKNLLISINKLAVKINHKVAITGAVDKYVVKYFIEYDKNKILNTFV